MQQVFLDPWRQFEITCVTNGHSTEFEGMLPVTLFVCS